MQLSSQISTGQFIRTYSNDYYAEPVVESEPDDDPDVGHDSTLDRFHQNLRTLDALLAPVGPRAWTCQPQSWDCSDGAVELMVKPTASQMTHQVMNPFIYRNIQDLGGLNGLADLLNAPPDWEGRFDAMMNGHAEIQGALNAFREQEEEPCIQSHLIGLVTEVRGALGTPRVIAKARKMVTVGGLLTRYIYDVRSATDPSFWVGSVCKFATQVTTDFSFEVGKFWHHKSRGIQTMCAMYGLNCPTFLLTQKHWKLFVQNRKRNGILTYPFGQFDVSPFSNSLLMGNMGRNFIKAIVICLLAEDPPFERLSEPTCQTEETTGQSCFVSGYNDGNAVYSYIRVLDDDKVAQIEKDTLAESRKKYRESDEATL